MKQRKRSQVTPFGKIQIVSLFGKIEEMVARQMMTEGKGITKLAPTESVSIDDIPFSVRYNERGMKANMVIVLPPQLRNEFERRIEELGE